MRIVGRNASQASSSGSASERPVEGSMMGPQAVTFFGMYGKR